MTPAILIGIALSVLTLVFVVACIHGARKRMPVEAILSGLVGIVTFPAAVFQLMAYSWAHTYIGAVLGLYMLMASVITIVSLAERQADSFWFGVAMIGALIAAIHYF